MDNELIVMAKEGLALAAAIISLVLSKYRKKENEKYANKYKDAKSYLLVRLLLTYLLKLASALMVIAILTDKLDIFIAFYILTPLLIAVNYICFNTDRMKGILTIIKGFYYIGLSVISIIQLTMSNQDVAELAIGFTLSLAIFESIIALSEGYIKINDSKK